MFEKLRNFWTAFWNSIKTAYNKAFKNPLETVVQPWRDILHINLPDIVINKLNNLANSEATFDVISDSALAERLKTLCKSLESKRFDITAGMLADGDYYVFPATDSKGELYHSYLTQERVRITGMDADRITDAYGIIDWTVLSNNNTYYLLRHHSLDERGDLTISYSVTDRNFNTTHLPQWDYIDGETVRFVGANHIGFGRYKSPTSSRGLSPVYGVPVNFGCAEIEKKIAEDLALIDEEFRNGKSVIFTDPRNLLKDEERKQYRIADNVIPIQQRSGATGSNIDIFNPTLRYSEFYNKLVGDLALYEKQIGTSKGILTDNETTAEATATAVRRANSDTLALLDKIRNAIDEGNEMTLAADAVYLNVAADLWDYQSDWYDPFDDPADQWQRLLDAKQNGAAQARDLIKWLFPRLDDDAVMEKLAAIADEQRQADDAAIDRILSGR